MGLARGWAVALAGLTGRLVSVEADVGTGLPGFALIGLPDTALSEARDRVKAAVLNCGEDWPKQKVTVSLSPADLRKHGSGFDVALAAVVLAAAGRVPAAEIASRVLIGELGLDGGLRATRGVLSAVIAAERAGFDRVVVPEPHAAEAALVEGVEVLGVRSLRQLLALLRGEEVPDDPPVPDHTPRSSTVIHPGAQAPGYLPDLADVRGQIEARWALEVAAAGHHHLFLHGGPGAGKTMLAQRLPGILPPLRGERALEATQIHSVAGLLPAGSPLITAPPYCRPHHSATQAAMVGGGSKDIRPGAVSLAHGGVLFLDEATEFRAGVLDSLREPLEAGQVLIARAGVTARFPAEFSLVMAANPCPCAATDPRSCTCSSTVRRRYLGRLSRPLLDRIDIQVMVDRPSRHELLAAGESESTATIASRVVAARERAARRLAGTPWATNAMVPGRALRAGLRVAAEAMPVIEDALDAGTLTARGVDRVLRLAWTVADLGGRDKPGRSEVHAALMMRTGIAGGWAA
ncbi:MAG: YifB family Mg chelatase-like AAA ATPase [Sporichthyaceae bacterium]